VFGRARSPREPRRISSRATRLARDDGDALGSLRELGTVSYGENQDEVFLGCRYRGPRTPRKRPVQKIDTEIRRFVEQGYNEATRFSRKSVPILKRWQKACLNRDADRRRDSGPAQRQEAQPRVGAGANRSTHLGGAAGGKPRPRPDRMPGWSRSRRRKP